MVPPVMVTSLTVLPPALLGGPMKWVFSTVRETTAVSPALLVVLSSVMEAMALSFRSGEDCADALIRGWVGGGHGAFLSMKWMDAGVGSGFVRPSWPVPRRTGGSAMPVVRPVGRTGLGWWQWWNKIRWAGYSPEAACRVASTHRRVGRNARWQMGPRQQASVASPIICRSALAIEAHRGVASLANTLGM